MKISSDLHFLAEIQDIVEVCEGQQDMMKISSDLHFLAEIQDIAEVCEGQQDMMEISSAFTCNITSLILEKKKRRQQLLRTFVTL